MPWFRHGVIGELAHFAPGRKGLYARLKEKADLEYCIPGSLAHARRRGDHSRLAPGVPQGRLLTRSKPRVRKDQGQSHALPQAVSDLLVSIKDERPDLSVHLVIREALATNKVPEGLQLAPSTEHRLLTRAGLMVKKPGEPTSKDHRRFVFEKAGDLWMSDVMHGPAVMVLGKKRKGPTSSRSSTTRRG